MNAYLKKVIIFAIALVLFLIATNPAILWFLPEGAKAGLLETWEGLFGNVSSVASVVTINWVSIFKIVAIVLASCLVGFGVYGALALHERQTRAGLLGIVFALAGIVLIAI